jgi:hypothetical protein
MVSQASRWGRANRRASAAVELGGRHGLVLLTALLCLAALTLAPMLAEDRRFHSDEAFFMTFARNAAVKGDWWLSGALDKPPLTIYAQAALLSFIGADTLPNGVLTLDIYKGEFVGRLLAFFSSMATLALAMRLTSDITRCSAAAAAVGLALTALPLFQLYSTAAFMDMPMLALALGALLAAHRGRPIASGALLALAFCAKPQGVFFAPLVLWYAVQTSGWSQMLRWSVSAGAVLVLLLGWDALRPSESVLLLGAANNDHLSLASSTSALLERLQAWLPAADGSLLAWLAVSSAGLLHPRTRALSGWMLLYGLGHALIFEALYERYLLLTAVIGAVSAPSAAFCLWRGQKRPPRQPWLQRAASGWVAAGAAAWLLVANGIYPAIAHNTQPRQMLEDYPRNSQIDQIAADLNALPVATVIYDHWLGWLLNYYMGAWHDKRIVYYPSPEALVAGIRALGEDSPRYFLIPTDAPELYGLSTLWSSDWRGWLKSLQQSFRVEMLQMYGAVQALRIHP